MTMANDKPTPKWRNFAAWSAVGAIFYVLTVWGASSLLHDDAMGSMFRSRDVAAMLGLGLVFAAAVVGFSGWKRPVNLLNLGNFATWNAVAIVAFLLAGWGFRVGAYGEMEGSEGAALVVGVIFLVMGLAIAAGLAIPNYGARYLNVEDAGELREQRPVLLSSAGGMVAWGLFLMLPAAGGPSGSVSPTAALVGAGALFVIATALTVVAWRLMDELMRSLSTEAGNMSYYLVALLGGGWALLAQVGFVAAPAPLDWLTMLIGLPLAASFIVAGRRGLLAKR